MPQLLYQDAQTELLFIPVSRFHTTLVSVNFFVPLTKDDVSKNALMSSMLTTCGKNHPDFSALNLLLTKLYGADLTSTIGKTGDFGYYKFCVSAVNDRFAFGGDRPLADAVALLLDLVFVPKIENGAFCETDLNRERRLLIEHINGEFNDKRTYARTRMTEEMFKDRPFGIYRLGYEDEIRTLTGSEVYSAYKKMFANAFVQINVVGESVPDDLCRMITERFSSVERRMSFDRYAVSRPVVRNQPQLISQTMQVAQGKLVMGFSTTAGTDRDTVAGAVMADVFGGGPYSRLFANVREKMSLCYYCSASYVRSVGLLMVDSGVEAHNADKAQEEILRQLSMMQEGCFDDFEYRASLKSLRDSCLTAEDSPERLDAWYTARALQKEKLSPTEYAELIGTVGKDDVKKAAETVRLDTVYRLLPQEGASLC